MSLPQPLEEITQSVLAWAEQMAEKPGELTGRWKYNHGAIRPWALESSAMMVNLLKTIGEIDRMTDEQRNLIIGAFRAWQSPEDGYFRDPLIGEDLKIGTYHRWDHVWFHSTVMCDVALRHLGARPRYPLPNRWFYPIERDTVRELVLSKDWRDAYHYGGEWAGAMMAYIDGNGITPGRTDENLEEGFAVIEQEVLNPETGFPDRRGCEDAVNASAGLFGIIRPYLFTHRPFPYAERALDSLLELQSPEGHYHKDNMCYHWDAIWLIKQLNERLGGAYRFEDIRAAGNKLAGFLYREHRKGDGAFSFHRDRCMEIHMSVRVSHPLPESDIVGTTMSWWSFYYADCWNRGEHIVPCPEEFWRKPAASEPTTLPNPTPSQ